MYVMRKYLLIIGLVFIFEWSFAQVYTEKQTRHRFAQMTLGIDIGSSIGGETSFLDSQGSIGTISLDRAIAPRFIIGGTHFWGHADFFIAIPLLATVQSESNQDVQYLRGVETGFKYYLLRIEHGKLRPFVGVSIAPFYYEQTNHNLTYGNGPELNHTALPLLGGVTYNSKSHLFELTLGWNLTNEQEYAISRDQMTIVKTPPLYANVAYKYMFETTLSAERNWESGHTQEVTDRLASDKGLNGVYAGVGMSSAFWIGESSYNKLDRPAIEKYNTSLMPDFTLGYYLHDQDMNLSLGYRGYGSSTNTYGAIQSAKRNSFLLEVTKGLFDYHGFVPFVGPNISVEKLSFIESFEGNETLDLQENKLGYGLTFGWDIRPNRITPWILRTNLRWYPDLKLSIDTNQDISFNNIEFNFIQLIVYLNRL